MILKCFKLLMTLYKVNKVNKIKKENGQIYRLKEGLVQDTAIQLSFMMIVSTYLEGKLISLKIVLH